MKYSIKEKIEVLGDMIERLEILADLISEEDIDASDNALRASKVMSNIREEYINSYKSIYGEDYVQ